MYLIATETVRYNANLFRIFHFASNYRNFSFCIKLSEFFILHQIIRIFHFASNYRNFSFCIKLSEFFIFHQIMGIFHFASYYQNFSFCIKLPIGIFHFASNYRNFFILHQIIGIFHFASNYRNFSFCIKLSESFILHLIIGIFHFASNYWKVTILWSVWAQTVSGLEGVVFGGNAEERHFDGVQFVVQRGGGIVVIDVRETELGRCETGVEFPNGLRLKKKNSG